MGACVRIALPPFPVSIKVPGGFDLSSVAGATQGVPNAMDPFQKLIEAAQPLLAAAKPVFDVVGFVIAIMELVIKIMTLLGVLLIPVAGPLNPLSLLFPVPPSQDNPALPDVGGLLTGLIDALAQLICNAMKAAGLIPQLSGLFTVKDILLTAIAFGEATMAQVNSLGDAFANLPPANTGNPLIDSLLQCAQDNAAVQMEHKLGPMANLVPLMALVSVIADLASRPLPAPIVTMANIMAKQPPEGLGLIPFPSQAAREDFLQLLQDMAVTGLPIQIPDFSDLSDIGKAIEDMRQGLAPVIPIIALVQVVVDKLTKC
jgi:hypothetical protein